MSFKRNERPHGHAQARQFPGASQVREIDDKAGGERPGLFQLALRSCRRTWRADECLSSEADEASEQQVEVSRREWEALGVQ